MGSTMEGLVGSLLEHTPAVGPASGYFRGERFHGLEGHFFIWLPCGGTGVMRVVLQGNEVLSPADDRILRLTPAE